MQRRPVKRPKRDHGDFTDLRVGMYCRVSLADRYEDGRQKSTEQQEAVGRRWVEQHGAQLVEVYVDDGVSASRFTRKERAEFNRMLSDIEDGKLDVLWFWEQSRLSRRQTEYFQLIDLCREHGVIWVNQDRMIDPADYKDTLAPGIMASIDAISSEQTSERIRRYTEANAYAGRPHGKNLYGFKRIYDPVTRKLERVDPDVFDKGGTAVQDSPAAVVREIFERIAAGESQRSIRRDLENRRIPAPGGGRRWFSTTVKGIARNPAYLGRRRHLGEVLDDVEAVWPGLVDEQTFWTVQRVLTDPERNTTRPARARWLLSNIAYCAECGASLVRVPTRSPGYLCSNRACVGIKQSALDSFVERVVVAWMSDEDVYAALSTVDDSAEIAKARADAERARAELEEWRHSAENREVTLATFKRVEPGLLARIQEADKRAQSATLPPVLRGRIGPGAEEAWHDEEVTPLEVKRQIIKALAHIRVRPVGREHGGIRVQDRLEWQWLLGPGIQAPVLPPDRPVPVKNQELLRALHRNGPTLQNGLHTLIGWPKSTAKRTLRQLIAQDWVARTSVKLPRGAPTFQVALTDEGRRIVATLNGS